MVRGYPLIFREVSDDYYCLNNLTDDVICVFLDGMMRGEERGDVGAGDVVGALPSDSDGLVVLTFPDMLLVVPEFGLIVFLRDMNAPDV